MKRKRQYESRVKTNAVIIYILASILCVGMIYYISNLKDSIDFQKRNIEKNETLLELTNELIDNVNNAQSYSNIYTFTADQNHLNNFNMDLTHLPSSGMGAGPCLTPLATRHICSTSCEH